VRKDSREAACAGDCVQPVTSEAEADAVPEAATGQAVETPVIEAKGDTGPLLQAGLTLPTVEGETVTSDGGMAGEKVAGGEVQVASSEHEVTITPGAVPVAAKIEAIVQVAADESAGGTAKAINVAPQADPGTGATPSKPAAAAVVVPQPAAAGQAAIPPTLETGMTGKAAAEPVTAGKLSPLKTEAIEKPQAPAAPRANASKDVGSAASEPVPEPQTKSNDAQLAMPKPQEIVTPKPAETSAPPPPGSDAPAPRAPALPTAPVMPAPEPIRALTASFNPVSLQAGNANEPQPVPLKAAEIAVEIVSRMREGMRRFDIRLDPPELGRIDVRLEVDRSGHATTRLTVDRPETLELLQREARGLERALEQSGLKTDRGGLEFSLRQQASEGQQNRPDAKPAADLLADDEAERSIAVIGGYRSSAVARGGVDIRV
jgi:chemotaxis protein MotD